MVMPNDINNRKVLRYNIVTGEAFEKAVYNRD